MMKKEYVAADAGPDLEHPCPDERSQHAREVSLPVCRSRKQLQLRTDVGMSHRAGWAKSQTISSGWSRLRSRRTTSRRTIYGAQSRIGMIGRLLRPASIVRLAAVIITTVCNNMINRSPTAVVAHPGMARSVARRVIVTAAMPAIETEATKAATSSARTKITSLWTDMTLRPCTTSDTRFIVDRPL